MTMDAAVKISEVIGVVSCPTDSKEADGGNFLRFRAIIDLSLPLCRGWLVSLGNEKQFWVSFKYERLSNLCYWCDCLTHDDKVYELWVDSEGTLQFEQRQFGLAIWAPVFVPSRKNRSMSLGSIQPKRRKVMLIHLPVFGEPSYIGSLQSLGKQWK